jgi:pimeloyl-ACP methyl ester carboxylesterase
MPGACGVSISSFDFRRHSRELSLAATTRSQSRCGGGDLVPAGSPPFVFLVGFLLHRQLRPRQRRRWASLQTSAMKPRELMRTVRYSKGWKRGSTGIEGTSVIIRREGRASPATFVRPVRASRRLPCWIAIGGVSLKGRFHPQLVRFAEALASTGAGVLVPELPEWRRLSVCPRVILPTVRASVEYLNTRSDVLPGDFGVIGFSFGATGAVLAASDDEIVEDIGGAVVFGGYCCLTRTVGCMLTGDHEWEDRRHRLQPDPYGRWVVASNYLTQVPGYEDATDVAQAVKRLATVASSQRVSAWEPYHDQMITALRRTIAPKRRPLFDILATPTADPRPDQQECAAFATALTDTCRAAEPRLDPLESLPHVRVPTQVIHGRGDRLVPFTEGMRLMEHLPATFQRGVTVTAMFNHSKDHVPPGPVAHLFEKGMLLRALHQLVNTV